MWYYSMRDYSMRYYSMRSRLVPCLVLSAQPALRTDWLVGSVASARCARRRFPVAHRPSHLSEAVRFLVGQDHPEAGPCVRIPAAPDSRRYSRRTASTRRSPAVSLRWHSREARGHTVPQARASHATRKLRGARPAGVRSAFEEAGCATASIDAPCRRAG